MLETNACVENARSNFNHTHTASYQRLPNRPQINMIATHKYSPPKTGGITLSYSPPNTHYIHKLYIYAITFSAGLNGLQVDQVDRENEKRTSTHTQLVPSKLVASCNVRVQLSGCGLTIHATTTQFLREKLRNVRRRTRSMLATVSRP